MNICTCNLNIHLYAFKYPTDAPVISPTCSIGAATEESRRMFTFFKDLFLGEEAPVHTAKLRKHSSNYRKHAEHVSGDSIARPSKPFK